MGQIEPIDEMIAIAQIIEESGNRIMACRNVQTLLDISLADAVNLVASMLANKALIS